MLKVRKCKFCGGAFEQAVKRVGRDLLFCSELCRRNDVRVKASYVCRVCGCEWSNVGTGPTVVCVGCRTPRVVRNFGVGTPMVGVCDRCGSEFEYVKRRGPALRYCPEHLRSAKVWQCRVCDGTFCWVPGRARVPRNVCSDGCASYLVVCVECGVAPRRSGGAAKYCLECARKVRRRRKKRGNASRRLRDEVFERDGWVCWLCEGQIDSELVWPDRWSASVDHVIPHVLPGGVDSLENLRAAHLSCNSARGKG